MKITQWFKNRATKRRIKAERAARIEASIKKEQERRKADEIVKAGDVLRAAMEEIKTKLWQIKLRSVGGSWNDSNPSLGGKFYAAHETTGVIYEITFNKNSAFSIKKV